MNERKEKRERTPFGLININFYLVLSFILNIDRTLLKYSDTFFSPPRLILIISALLKYFPDVYFPFRIPSYFFRDTIHIPPYSLHVLYGHNHRPLNVPLRKRYTVNEVDHSA